MLPNLYVIILNWNHKEDLILTVDSFLKQDYSNFKIVVADNGSIDGSIEYLKREHPNIILIENGSNLGYAAGNNRAIEYVLQLHADYILLVNNDIYIDNTKLISQIIADLILCPIENIGIYGIQERSYYSRNHIESEGNIFFDDFSARKKQFNTFRDDFTQKNLMPYKYVDFISGSFILIKTEVFKNCGLLDEAFFMYHEEAEFCFRAWNNGYKVVINPTFNYFHKIAKSSGSSSPLGLYYRVRNNFYFLYKHKEKIRFYSFYYRRYSFAIILSFIRLSGLLLFRYKSNIEKWKALIEAIIDAKNHAYYKRF